MWFSVILSSVIQSTKLVCRNIDRSIGCKLVSTVFLRPASSRYSVDIFRAHWVDILSTNSLHFVSESVAVQ